ncbi:lytic murein transglycosylase [Conexibacter sp. JD483]|uniref:lytic murein transglycosylase n=1 Tax=unclassified Conexibacter TaxID=2627773 RepID=UPI002727A3D3|nr:MULTISPECIES: lytic murein transglycosylase [unclassified Conexibacter]MDO8185871.1 lytic murein transglycosylase [Conexibacter sp. CPCC 205706]MDO8198614.1 lytic murein transglycosylase [Conexibacter sp. CPCC 205762]MDR9367700.1 lytic murein transglycosylase [Conexibacter sp. JD483]
MRAGKTALWIKLTPFLLVAGLITLLALLTLALAKTKNTAAAAALCDPTYLAQQGEMPGGGVGQSALARREVPQRLVPIYLAAATRYRLGPDGWSVLASINKIETSFGTNVSTSSAGAVGWMQFMPGTWDSYGVDANGDGERDPYEPRDAIHAAANYLRASGAPADWRKAVFAYNHADWYVNDVLQTAASYRGPPSSVQVADGTSTTTGRRATAPPPANPAAIQVGASYSGFASVYGNDPAAGVIDAGDNNIPRLEGATNDVPGIAIFNDQTLGGWWSVEAPDGTVAILQQTDYGPSASGRDGVRRTVDVNAVAARVVFRLAGDDRFPTDQGVWTVVYMGKQRPAGAIGADNAQPDRDQEPPTFCVCPAPIRAAAPGDVADGGIPNANGGVGFTPVPGKDFSSGREPEIARRAHALGLELGLRLTGISGRRDPAHNQAVGGSPTSQHLTGEAADIDGIQDVPEATLNRFGLHRPIPGAWHSPTDGQVHDERNHIVLNPGTENLSTAEAIAGQTDPDAAVGDPSEGEGSDPCLDTASASTVPGQRARILPDGTAAAPEDAPASVKAMIAAGNELLRSRYRYGGAHGTPLSRLDPGGYDCSSAVSYVLFGGKAFPEEFAMDSTGLMSYGADGVGKWVTVLAHSGHAFVEIAGIRLDTSRVTDSGPRRAESGPRWRTLRSHAGFTARHPEGL